MNKLYNTQEDIATKIINFLLSIFPNMRKTQLKILPYICIGMIISESTVASDIAKSLKDKFSLVKHDSVVKRIKRFFTNKLFNAYEFYNTVIKYVIKNYKSIHPNKRVHIIFDHMFSHDNFTVFMITMRIGKQGIPLYFRCFKGTKDTEAFRETVILEGISFVSNLFDESFDLIFLADRWFTSTTIMQHIDSLGHTYCIRLKGNLNATINDKKKKRNVTTKLNELEPRKNRAKAYHDVEITDNKFITNIVISKKNGNKDHWIIATNGDTNRTIIDYGYRFGGIETVFKNQKSNGLHIESVVNASEQYFISMYTIACFVILLLTIIGADYSKNSSTIYNKVKLSTHKNINGKKTRVMSLFNTGLTLFKIAYNSLIYIRIPLKLILYDV